MIGIQDGECRKEVSTPIRTFRERSTVRRDDPVASHGVHNNDSS